MNPLDFNGPDFLAFYTLVLCVAAILAMALRWYFRQTGWNRDSDLPELSLYEMAYLAGGDKRACDAAIARLVHEGALMPTASRARIRVVGDLAIEAAELERAIHQTARLSNIGQSPAALRAAGARALQATRHRLVSAGLVVAPAREFAARFLPALLMIGVLALGIAKILVGLSRQKPVGNLLVLCLVAAAVAFCFGSLEVFLTAGGDLALEKLRKCNAAMEHALSRQRSDVSSNDVLLAVGLFGITAIPEHSLEDLRRVLAQPPSPVGGGSGSSCGSSGCGSSGSSSSCGGGCGGGCGGCGS